jgi:hypothetical protein
MQSNFKYFNEFALTMGMTTEAAELSMKLPPLHEGVMHFRAFCLAEVLFKKVSLDNYGISWAEVKNVFTYSEDKIFALIQFNSCVNAFPLEIPLSTLKSGKGDFEKAISQVVYDLPERIRVWLKITKHGFKKITIREFLMKCSGNVHNHSI